MPLGSLILESYKHFVVSWIQNRAFMEFARFDSFCPLILSGGGRAHPSFQRKRVSFVTLAAATPTLRDRWPRGHSCFSIRRVGSLEEFQNLLSPSLFSLNSTWRGEIPRRITEPAGVSTENASTRERAHICLAALYWVFPPLPDTHTHTPTPTPVTFGAFAL